MVRSSHSRFGEALAAPRRREVHAEISTRAVSGQIELRYVAAVFVSARHREVDRGRELAQNVEHIHLGQQRIFGAEYDKPTPAHILAVVSIRTLAPEQQPSAVNVNHYRKPFRRGLRVVDVHLMPRVAVVDIV